jgi:hypothetical protein
MYQRVDQTGTEQDGQMMTGASSEPVSSGPSRAALAIVALLVAIIAASGVYWWQRQQGQSPMQAPAVQAPPPVVTVANPVVMEIVEWDDCGPVRRHRSRGNQAPGQRLFAVGAFCRRSIVKKGDLLYVIDKRPFEIELQSAKAQLAEAKA